MIESESYIRVRYVETDAMGIAHHSNFILWFELARVEMMDNIGLPYIELEKQGVLMPVLEVHVKFFSPAYFDDKLRIKLTIRDCPRVRLKVEYEVLREEILLARGESAHTFINRNGKVVRPPNDFLELVRQYF